jgi:putative ATP-dependent endonuclease of the OLD family
MKLISLKIKNFRSYRTMTELSVDDFTALIGCNDVGDAVNARGGRDIAFLTAKRELENYIHEEAIRAEYGFAVVVDDWCDVPDMVAEHVHTAGGGRRAWTLLDLEIKRKKQSRAKRRLNAGATAHMTLLQLQEKDPGGEILRWLHAIRDRA